MSDVTKGWPIPLATRNVAETRNQTPTSIPAVRIETALDRHRIAKNTEAAPKTPSNNPVSNILGTAESNYANSSFSARVMASAADWKPPMGRSDSPDNHSSDTIPLQIFSCHHSPAFEPDSTIQRFNDSTPLPARGLRLGIADGFSFHSNVTQIRYAK
jgi:hypothetical protein